MSSSSKRSSSADSSSVLRAASGSKSSRCPYRTSAAIRTVVSGVRSSWETSETNCCCTWERSSSSVILRSSSVAMWFIDRARPGQVLGADHGHPVVQMARGEPFRRQPRGPDRTQHLPRDQPHHGHHAHQHDQSGDHRRPLHHRQRVGLGLVGEQEVDRVPRAARSGQRRADRQSGHRRTGVGEADLGGRGIHTVGAQHRLAAATRARCRNRGPPSRCPTPDRPPPRSTGCRPSRGRRRRGPAA